MAQVLRNAGLPVQEENGWQRRARGSGGYSSGLPTHIMVHHTASNKGSDGQSDVNYMCYGSSSAPIANLYLSRTGKIWVMAAGATNTNGQGRDTWGGGVPNDSMNTHAIGIEGANNGVGEPWPQVQQENYAKMVTALAKAYNIPNNKIRTHFEWAPTRKIDNAGQSRWATGANKWNMVNFRKDLANGWPGTPLPPVPGKVLTNVVEDTKMHYYIKPENEASASTIWISDGTYKWAARNNEHLDNDKTMQTVRLVSAGMPGPTAEGFNKLFVVNKNAWMAYGLSIDPNMPGRDPWGWKA